MENWWESFFDADYVRLWVSTEGMPRRVRKAEGIWQVLQLKEGSRVLDAPCGYGRLALLVAERGAGRGRRY